MAPSLGVIDLAFQLIFRCPAASNFEIHSSPISSFQISGFAWINFAMRSLHSVESRLTISTPREMRKSSPPADGGKWIARLKARVSERPTYR